MDFLHFLFDFEGNLRVKRAPKLKLVEPGGFILSYEVPGEGRLYKLFKSNVYKGNDEYLKIIFEYFSISNSTLSRCKSNRYTLLKPKPSKIKRLFGIVSDEDRKNALYNMELAVKQARKNHSLRLFDLWLSNWKILNPGKKYSYNNMLKEFDNIVSSVL